jgi:quercetin dioxygenase-like cupin family protein
MQVATLNEVELVEASGLRFGFPISSATGTGDSAVVSFELDPGAVLPVHTDSAEELLLVLEGVAEATIGDETGTVRAGDVAVVPALAPHGLRNVGDVPVRVVGFFASSTVVSLFPEGAPTGDQVFVIGTPFPLAMPLPEGAVA